MIAISSASVYADDAGRTLDEAAETGFPQLPVPTLEPQRTVEPGPQTYSTRKAAMECALLEDDRLRATIMRPCAIYGPGAALAREWFFVKRALDAVRRRHAHGRTRAPLPTGDNVRARRSSDRRVAR